MYFRARFYDSTTGEFISRDPMEYVDGMSLYRGYFVPNQADPFGDLTRINKVRCIVGNCVSGGFVSVSHDWLLDKPANSGGGYIVQHIEVSCFESKCPCNEGKTPTGTSEYYETWEVPRLRTPLLPFFVTLAIPKTGSPRKGPGCINLKRNDWFSVPLEKNICRTFRYKSEVRYYKRTIVNNNGGIRLQTGWSNDGNRTFGPDDCSLRPGPIDATENRPKFWDEDPVEALKFEETVTTSCCLPLCIFFHI